MLVVQNKIYSLVISIKEIFGSFNNGQFVSLAFLSIFVSPSFLFFICVIIPFALSIIPYRALSLMGLCCPLSFLYLGCPHKNHLALQRIQSWVYFSHAFQGLLHLVSPWHSLGLLLLDSQTSMHSKKYTKLCYCYLQFSLFFCAWGVFLQGHGRTIPGD